MYYEAEFKTEMVSHTQNTNHVLFTNKTICITRNAYYIFHAEFLVCLSLCGH